MTELEVINERIDGVEDRLGEIHKNVNLMVILLRGNEFDKSDGGMIGDQNEMKRRLERLERFKDKMTWVFVGAGLVTGLNLVQLVDLIVSAIKGHK